MRKISENNKKENKWGIKRNDRIHSMRNSTNRKGWPLWAGCLLMLFCLVAPAQSSAQTPQTVRSPQRQSQTRTQIQAKTQSQTRSQTQTKTQSQTRTQTQAKNQSQIPPKHLPQKPHPVDRALIRASLVWQMEHYPESRLQDIYKSFYQDRFGPEHMVTDSAAVLQYLREELKQCDARENPRYEPTAYLGNYDRVYLSCVVRGNISAERLNEAFVRSSRMPQASLTDWKTEWKEILSVIEELQLSLENYENDKEKIARALKEGDVAMHHSEAYRNAYHPHYRIVERHLLEQELLPLLASPTCE